MKKYENYDESLQLKTIKLKVLNDDRFGYNPVRKELVGKTVEVYDALFSYYGEYMLYTTREFTKKFSSDPSTIGLYLPIESTSYNREKKLKRILKDNGSNT